MSRGSVSHSYEYISTYSNAIQQIVPDRFILKIRQQPVQTRLSTSNERDRRPLDPPPIVQIELDNTTAQETQDFLQNPYLFMCVSLVHPNTHEEMINSPQNTLSGQTCSSMYKLKDINNHDGGFFVFGDVSVKLEGQYRLRFSMFEISKFGAANLKSIYSNVFQVYPSKSFPGMLESTFLSRSFSDQGVRIRIRKEHRVQMTGSRKRKLSSQDESLELDNDRSFNIDRPHHQQQHQCYHTQQQHPQLVQMPSHKQRHPHHPYSTSVAYQQQQQRPSQMQHHWSPNPEIQGSYDNRRGSLNSIMTASNDMGLNPRRLSHIDRKPSIPYSPPHQSYDNNNSRAGPNDHGNYDHHRNAKSYHHHSGHQQDNYLNVHRNNSMIPSPPPQPSLFKPEVRRLSLDGTLSANGGNNSNIMRRQSADPHLYNSDHYRRGSRRMSLQQQSPHIGHPSQPLPPMPVTRSSPNNYLLNSGEVIHLPPLRTIVPSNNSILQPEQQCRSPLLPPPTAKHRQFHHHPHHHQQQDGIGEVDAAVAMIQMASRRQAEAKVSY